MYPSRPLLLTWGGQIGQDGGGSDIWQCGLHLGNLDSAADPDLPTAAELGLMWDGAIRPFHADANTQINKGAVLTWIKAVVLTTAGRYATEPVIYQGTPQPGGMTGENGAPQNSMVVTLWSGLSLGKGNYGRFYLPWNGRAAEPATGRLSSTATGYLLGTAGLFLSNVNDIAGAWTGGTEVLIYGKTGSGTKRRPTFVKVGDVVDTQRRRRNRIKEAYSVAAIAP